MFSLFSRKRERSSVLSRSFVALGLVFSCSFRSERAGQLAPFGGVDDDDDDDDGE